MGRFAADFILPTTPSFHIRSLTAPIAAWVMSKPKLNHIIPLLKPHRHHHHHPVASHAIKTQTLTMAHRILHDQTLGCLSDLISYHFPSLPLLKLHTGLLTVPQT